MAKELRDKAKEDESYLYIEVKCTSELPKETMNALYKKVKDYLFYDIEKRKNASSYSNGIVELLYRGDVSWFSSADALEATNDDFVEMDKILSKVGASIERIEFRQALLADDDITHFYLFTETYRNDSNNLESKYVLDGNYYDEVKVSDDPTDNSFYPVK